MSSIDRRVILAGAGIVGAAALARLAKAGDLNPPQGPIGPTGKTLQELYDRVTSTGEKVARTAQGYAEPRTPLSATACPAPSSSQFCITQPGAYYLTSNLTGEQGRACIDIQCDNVTIDGNGFTIDGVTGTSSCVRASGRSNLELFDLTVSSWSGPACDFADCSSCFVSDCTFRSCVAHGDPVAGGGSVVSLGASSECTDCAFRDCDSDADGFALSVGSSSVINGNTVIGGIGGAYRCADGCCVQDSTVVSRSGLACLVGNDCVVCDNQFVQCGGVSCLARCVVSSNECVSCSSGVDVHGECVVSENTVVLADGSSSSAVSVHGPGCSVQENYCRGGGGGGGGGAGGASCGVICVDASSHGTHVDCNQIEDSSGSYQGSFTVTVSASRCSVTGNTLRCGGVASGGGVSVSGPDCCVCDNQISEGALVVLAGGDGTECDDNKIQCSNVPAGTYVIVVDAYRCSVTSNVVHSSSGGVSISGRSCSCVDNQVSVTGADAAVFVSSSATGTQLEENHVDASGTYSGSFVVVVSADSCGVVSNTVCASGACLSVSGSRCNVEENTLTLQPFGGSLTVSGALVVESSAHHTQIECNQISCDSSVSLSSLVSVAAPQCNVVDNSLRGSGGISVSGQGCTVVDNSVSLEGGSAPAVAMLSGSDDCLVECNEVSCDSSYTGSFVVVVSSSRVCLFDNSLQCVGGGVSVTGTDCQVEENHVTLRGVSGGLGAIVVASGADGARVESNSVVCSSSYTGSFVVVISATRCFVARNSVKGGPSTVGATSAFQIAAGNAFGPLVSAAGAGSLLTVTGAGNPLSNVAH